MHSLRATRDTSTRLERAAYQLSLYSVVGIFIGFGAYKFTAQEASAIFPLVSHHPLLGWLYTILSVQGVSNLIGILELASALAMAWPGNWRIRVIGSAGVAVALVVTVSFLVTTPDINGSTFGFLIKDMVLLGVALLVAVRTFAEGHARCLHPGPMHPASR